MASPLSALRGYYCLWALGDPGPRLLLLPQHPPGISLTNISSMLSRRSRGKGHLEGCSAPRFLFCRPFLLPPPLQFPAFPYLAGQFLPPRK